MSQHCKANVKVYAIWLIVQSVNHSINNLIKDLIGKIVCSQLIYMPKVQVEANVTFIKSDICTNYKIIHKETKTNNRINYPVNCIFGI